MASTDTTFHKVIANIVNDTFAIMEHDLLFSGYNEEARIKKTYDDHIRTALEMAVGDTMDVMDKVMYDNIIHRFGGYLAVIKKYFEVVDSIDIFQLPEYKTANLLMRHTITEYIHNDTTLVEYEQYKQWTKINGGSDNEDEDEDGMNGDDVDEYVRKEYGEDAQWIFMSSKDDFTDYDTIETLPNFVVRWDDGTVEKGIMIIIGTKEYSDEE